MTCFSFITTTIFDSPADLMHVWSSLCQSGPLPPPPEFKEVYPFVTTVKGNRFRFRGGDPARLSASLERLYHQRRSFYGQAHRRIDAGHAGVDALVEELTDWLEH